MYAVSKAGAGAASGSGAGTHRRIAPRKAAADPRAGTRDLEDKSHDPGLAIVRSSVDASSELLYKPDSRNTPSAPRGRYKRMAPSWETPRSQEVELESRSRRGDSDSQSSSIRSDTAGSPVSRNRRVYKAARKRDVGAKILDEGDDDDGHLSEEVRAHNKQTGIRKGARKTTAKAPGHRRSSVSRERHKILEPPEDLAMALKNMSIYHPLASRRQIAPSRILRKGFLGRFKESGVSVNPEPPQTGYFNATFVLLPDVEVEGESPQTHTISCKGWSCPLGCPAFRGLPTKDLLDHHLRGSLHDGILVEWEKPEREHEIWQLTLSVPESAENNSDNLSDASDSAPASPRARSPDLLTVDYRPESRASVIHYPSDRGGGTTVESKAIKTPPQTSPVEGKGASTGDKRHQVQSPIKEEDYGGPVLTSTIPQRAIDELLLPRASPPYLPAKSHDGTIVRSYRPGGPKLYDLVNTLSLKEYGLQTWRIVEHEDSIFEGDDMLDEDKVMAALWGRWITLHRTSALSDSDLYKCVKDFVLTQDHLILEWAGPRSLRTFLFGLIENRLLTSTDAAVILKEFHRTTNIPLDAPRQLQTNICPMEIDTPVASSSSSALE